MTFTPVYWHNPEGTFNACNLAISRCSLSMMVKWANEGLLLANDGKMIVYDGQMLFNDDEMSVYIYSFHHH